jgi:hypothetical protein
MGEEYIMSNNKTPDRIQVIWNMIGGDDVVDRLIAGTAKLVVEAIRRLTDPVTITLPSGLAPKRLKDRGNVKLWPNAEKLFATVEELPEQALRLERRDLTESANDLELIAELGGEDVTVSPSVATLELAFCHLIDRVEDESDDLLSDGRANIGYVRDPADPKRVLYVNVDRVGDEWDVHSLGADASPWDAEIRVFKATVA